MVLPFPGEPIRGDAVNVRLRKSLSALRCGVLIGISDVAGVFSRVSSVLCLSAVGKTKGVRSNINLEGFLLSRTPFSSLIRSRIHSAKNLITYFLSLDLFYKMLYNKNVPEVRRRPSLS